MNENAARQQAHQRRRAPIGQRRKTRRRPFLIVIFGKAERVFEKKFGDRAQPFSHSTRRIMCHETIEQPLVVGIIETQREQFQLGIPVGFGNQDEIGIGALGRCNGFIPELTRHGAVKDFLGQPRIPLATDLVTQQQHGHVAPDAIAKRCQPNERVAHVGPRASYGVVKLHRVFPASEVWVLAMCQAASRWMPVVVVAVFIAPLRVAVHEVFRVRQNERCVTGKVIGDEIKHQPQPMAVSAPAERRKIRFVAKLRVEMVVTDGVGRADKVRGMAL